jgi:hypothetical protein
LLYAERQRTAANKRTLAGVPRTHRQQAGQPSKATHAAKAQPLKQQQRQHQKEVEELQTQLATEQGLVSAVTTQMRQRRYRELKRQFQQQGLPVYEQLAEEQSKAEMAAYLQELRNNLLKHCWQHIQQLTVEKQLPVHKAHNAYQHQLLEELKMQFAVEKSLLSSLSMQAWMQAHKDGERQQQRQQQQPGELVAMMPSC